ncbi:hypothetical protein Sjap_012809 [Stephania japonica]|uniref:Pentatricopeptide repeat-containing protein n=1 Tax=Stephania japonica TaxID=461633 RepID=A0AAP0IWM5_9MAGN
MGEEGDSLSSKQGDFQDFTQHSASMCDSEPIAKRGFVISKGNIEKSVLKTDLGVSSISSNGNDLMIVAPHGVQELEMKVQSLEEDNRIMMKEMLAVAQERRELLREVSEMFRIMIMDHPLEKLITEEESLEGSTKDDSLCVRKADSSPFLVTRVLKANTLSFRVLSNPSHPFNCSAQSTLNTTNLRTNWPQLLQFSIGSKDLKLGLTIHAFLLKSPTPDDPFQANNLINLYGKLGRLDDAQRVFDEMPARNTITWTSLMTGYSQANDTESVFRIAHDMCLSGEEFSEQTCVVALQACRGGDWFFGEQVHGLVVKRMFDHNVVVSTSLMSLYSRNNSLDCAERVFNNVVDADVQCFNAMIVEYARNGDGKSAVRMFCALLSYGLKPNEYTFTSSICACSSNNGDEEGKQLHGLSIKYGYASATTVGNAVITMYGKFEFTDEARKMFCKMGDKNVVSWTALLSCYAKSGDIAAAMELFVEMLNMSVDLDAGCLANVIDGCSECNSIRLVPQIHGLVIKLGYASDVCVETSLIDAYARFSELKSARVVFDSSSRSMASFNAVLLGYMKSEGNVDDDYMNLLMKLRSAGLQPDAITFSRLISLSANQASIARGRSLHAYAIKVGLETELIVSNAVITMYAKCGNIKDATDKKKALIMLKEMKKANITSDEKTVVTVLQACSYSGLFEEGFRLFYEIQSQHRTRPVIEHYACMIDLLAKWGSEHWESGFKRLLELDSEYAASYILVSNMYAASGVLDKAAEARKMLNDQKLIKAAGCSWIEIENKVHRFVANGTDHPASREILMILEVLTSQMRDGWNAKNELKPA